MKYFALAIALLMCVASAQAFTTVCIKGDNDETDRGYDRTVDIACDGTYMAVGSSLNDTNRGGYYALVMNTDSEGYHNAVTLVGWKGMFDEIPEITSVDDIDSATLKMYQRGTWAEDLVCARRVTSQWLLQDPGSNEYVATGLTRAAGGESTTWAAGEAGFGSGDYTRTGEALWTLAPYDVDQETYVDVTQIVKDMFTEGNQGFALFDVAPIAGDPWFQGD